MKKTGDLCFFFLQEVTGKISTGNAPEQNLVFVHIRGFLFFDNVNSLGTVK